MCRKRYMDIIVALHEHPGAVLPCIFVAFVFALFVKVTAISIAHSATWARIISPLDIRF